MDINFNVGRIVNYSIRYSWKKVKDFLQGAYSSCPQSLIINVMISNRKECWAHWWCLKRTKQFQATYGIDGKKMTQHQWELKAFLNMIKIFTVEKVEKETSSECALPYTTSSMQMDAPIRSTSGLHQGMMVAQQLYEESILALVLRCESPICVRRFCAGQVQLRKWGSETIVDRFVSKIF